MSALDLIICALWAGAVGYVIGHNRALERGRRDTSLRFVGKELSVTLEWRGIERLLDERGLIAVPKGADFSERRAARPEAPNDPAA